jgi:autotransporter-associated beta strand protein
LDLGFGTITIPSGGSVIVDVVTNTLENDGNITSGNTRVIKSGNGTWIMGGRTSSGNNLQLEVSAGTVQMAKVSGQTIGYGTIGLTVDAGALAIDENSQQISSDSVVTPVPVNLPGGTLDLNGFSENVDNIFISNGGTIQDSGASGTTSILNIIYGNGRMATLTGTNCQFNVVNSGATLTFEGPIGGSGSLVSIGAGTLNLESNNTYTGSTVISNGTLALPNAGSISNSSNIILLTPNTALDLSNNTNTPNTGALSLQNGQTLSGFGTVTGMVITVTGATVAPGSATAVGTLLATGVGANTLGGTALMKLDAGHATNDQLSVGGSLAYGGTLALTNLSGTLVAGKSFTLFQAAGGYSGTFANITPSRPGFPDFGLAWNTNNLAVDGILSVVTSPVPPPPTITNISFSGGMLTIKGTRGLPNEPFLLQESANVGLTPLSAWTTVATGNFDANGNFTVSITPAGAPEFFVVWMQ